MKVNLLLDNDAGALPGYYNFDPMASQGMKTLVCDISDDAGATHGLSQYVEDGEAEELRAFNILSFFDAGRATEIISRWAKKVSRGGSIIIGDVDIIQAWKAYQRAEMNFLELNLVLFGEQKKPWMFRKCGLCLQEVAEALIGNGLEVVEKKLYSVLFEIKAVRP